MTQLNRAAAEALAALPPDAVHARTDVTGFGLIGHATEMAKASGGVVAIELQAVPVPERARDLVEPNTPAGGRTNLHHSGGHVEPPLARGPPRVQLAYDP